MFKANEHQRQNLYKTVLQYLAEYGSNSFIELSLQHNPLYLFPGHFSAIPFVSVEILRIEYFRFVNEIPITTYFPNVKILKLGHNCYYNRSEMKMHVPSVKHLFFDTSTYLNELELGTDDVLEMLKLNPQLEKLDLQLSDARYTSGSYFHWDPKIIKELNYYFPYLKSLKLYVPWYLLFQTNSTSIHFDDVEDFSSNFGEYIPFSFSKLKHLDLKSSVTNFTHPPVRDLIDKSNYLTSITVQSKQIKYVESFFGKHSRNLHWTG